MKKYLFLALLTAAVCIGAFFYFRRTTDVSFSESTVSTTPAKIEKIRQIGEWEFLAIADEEIVDTTAVVKRIWPIPDSKKQLARIYKGTLRIGFDLRRDTVPGWIKANGDTIAVTLPKVHLLDERFIDEAATRSLFEDGEWTNSDRDALYHKAVIKMKRNCLTPDNMTRARESARVQMENLLRSLGFKTISISQP